MLCCAVVGVCSCVCATRPVHPNIRPLSQGQRQRQSLSPCSERRVRSALSEASSSTAVEATIPWVELQELLLFLQLELGLLDKWCKIRDHWIVVLLLNWQMTLLEVQLDCAHHSAVPADCEVLRKNLEGTLNQGIVHVVLVIKHQAILAKVSDL